jgi:hypothetical protein
MLEKPLLTIKVKEDDVKDGAEETSEEIRATRLTVSSVHEEINMSDGFLHAEPKEALSVGVNDMNLGSVGLIEANNGIRASEIGISGIESCDKTNGSIQIRPSVPCSMGSDGVGDNAEGSEVKACLGYHELEKPRELSSNHSSIGCGSPVVSARTRCPINGNDVDVLLKGV